MQRYLAGIALSVCVLLAGCGSKELTRSKAATLIKQQLIKDGVNRMSDKLVLGDLEVPYPTLEGWIHDDQGGRLYAIFAKRKLVGLTLKGTVSRQVYKGSFGAMEPKEFGTINVHLTEEGKRYVMGGEGIDNGHKYVPIVMCDQVLDSITGITLEGSNQTARVEYKLKLVNPTPFALAESEWAGRPICNPELIDRSLMFRLFDDGWRIGN